MSNITKFIKLCLALNPVVQFLNISQRETEVEEMDESTLIKCCLLCNDSNFCGTNNS